MAELARVPAGDADGILHLARAAVGGLDALDQHHGVSFGIGELEGRTVQRHLEILGLFAAIMEHLAGIAEREAGGELVTRVIVKGLFAGLAEDEGVVFVCAAQDSLGGGEFFAVQPEEMRPAGKGLVEFGDLN